jgi:hypothetical protein
MVKQLTRYIWRQTSAERGGLSTKASFYVVLILFIGITHTFVTVVTDVVTFSVFHIKIPTFILAQRMTCWFKMNENGSKEIALEWKGMPCSAKNS